jgi:hypothetical protein
MAKLDQIRILMGDEVTKRTQRALVEGIARVKSLLDDSIEREKQKNDFLTGVPAIVKPSPAARSSAGSTPRRSSTPRRTSRTASWPWWARLRWSGPATSHFPA